MTESMKYYESIRRKYPETVSKDQFYQIAHISKATALHLLQNGLKEEGLGGIPTSIFQIKGRVSLIENRRVYIHRLCLLFSKIVFPRRDSP